MSTILKWLLYTVLAGGVGFLLIVLGIAPSPLVEGKLAFIVPHKILGYIFLALVLCHAIMHRKWYKAWLSGRLKKTKSNQITKLLSILFLLIVVFFLFGSIFSREIYALGHSAIGLTWIMLMIYHFKAKKNAARKRKQ